MKSNIRFLLLSVFLILPIYLFAVDKTVQSVTVTPIDTFALKGMPAQPVLKIHVVVSGTSGSLTLQKLVVNTLNLNNSDVDSVAIYYTKYYNRFSIADYPGESFLIDKRKQITGDSIVINYSLELESGDNYFWVTMDLSKVSRASRYIAATIKANKIKIGNNTYPSENETSNNVNIFDIYFKENFESRNMQNEPINWTQQQLDNSPVRWVCRNGGYGTSSGTGHPSAAKSGNYNAMLFWYNQTPFKTLLISKSIDLSLSSRPLLTFYHAQASWFGLNDELRVLYRTGEIGEWHPLDSFQLATPSAWIKRQIYLPENLNPNNLQLGFEGKTKLGWGVCIDSICIYETKIVSRSVNDVEVKNPVTDDVPQGSNNNPIARINIKIKGNTGNIALNSLKVTSNNTLNSDIRNNGVKLYYTNDSIYFLPVQIGSSVSFSGEGTATFTDLDRTLETGDNYFWVVYDVNTNAKPGNVLDVKINSGDIDLSGIEGTFPSMPISPVGQRIVKQSLFVDDFENTPSPWSLSGKFEIATPLGLGGNTKGFADPVAAYSGSKVLGTDLTQTGDYESNLTEANAYTAVSPLINAKYYKNISLDFQRYLNLDFTDVAAIDYKLENTEEWKNLWISENRYIESSWSKIEYSNLKFLEREKFNLRFRLGPTDAIDVYSGWNIDYLFFTADSIPYDAAVTSFISPVSACGLTNSEKVKVIIKNTGPQPLVNTPVKLSIDGGKTYIITENIAQTIKVDSSIVYTFTAPVDFSKPAMYTVVVKTAYPGDNYIENDSIISNVVSYPTYKLPYHTGFEQDTTFWFTSGQNSSWYHGRSYGSVISAAGEGEKCWKTDDGGFHKLKEYSYLTSPCFSFSGKELPMMDIKFNHYTNPNYDGAILEYSLDRGKNWIYAREDNFPFPWNWYNDTVYSLGRKGWTNRSLDGSGKQVWKQGRQILPGAIANKDTVIFRFVFKSDSVMTTTRYEGFAFDDFKVYDAPFDIGISSITGLSDPACQYANSPFLNVVIKNYGYRRMAPGDTVIIGASVNGLLQAVDTMKLTSYLIRNATLNYTLKKPVNFSQTGKYTIKAFTRIENDKSFYGLSNNDTVSVTLTVYQNPVTSLPDSIYSARIDTIELNTIDSVNYSYYWQGSAIPGTHIYNNVTDTGKYSLRVVNTTSLCETKDTVVIKALVPDISVKQIVSPADNCGYQQPVHPVIKIVNEGTDTLRVNSLIPLKIQLNSNTAISDNITLKEALAPDSSLVDTLSSTLNLGTPGLYSLKIYSSMPYDNIKSNDTAELSFQIYGYPSLNFSNRYINISDTIYRLSAPAGFISYLWSNDSTTRFNTVKKSGWYSCTVTDTHLCPARDSVHVYLKIRDIKATKLVSPVSACTNSGLSDIVIRILNAGSDTIKTNDSIFVSYRLNGGSEEVDTLRPLSIIIPGDSIDFKFKKQEDFTSVASYNMDINAVSHTVPDFYPINDSLKTIVKTYGLPNPTLQGSDIMFAVQWKLTPGKYSTYKWQDGTTDSTWILTKNHFMSDNRYQVMVTDSNGCSALSPWYMRRLIVNDVEANQINMVTSSCGLSNKELVKIKIKNVGNTPIQASKIILLNYQLDEGAYSATDTLILNSAFVEEQVLDHTFKEPADLSVKKDHHLKIFVNYDQDINLVNDTLSHWIRIYGNPTIDFKSVNDSLVVDCPYVLDAGEGFISYLWNTTQNTQSISVSPGKYTVTVVDTNGCFGSQSVTVVEKVFDLGISGFGTSLTNCELSTTETIGVKIKNTGTVSLSNQSINIQYILNGTINKNQDFQFTGKPGTETLFNFSGTENLSAINIHNFNVTLTNSVDEKESNNNQLFNVTVAGYPVVDFGAVDDTLRSNYFPYTLDAVFGFSSYKWQDNSTNRTFSAPEQGKYTVTVTNSAGCSTTKSVFIKSTISVPELKNKLKFKIYPNPVSDVLWVDIDLKFSSNAIFEMVTSEGKVIYNQKLSGYKNCLESIDVSHFPKGLYFVRIKNKDWMLIDKVVLE